MLPQGDVAPSTSNCACYAGTQRESEAVPARHGDDVIPDRIMALTAGQIADNPALHRLVRDQARALLSAYEGDPRLSSVFATQQRWLMAHAGLSLVFRNEGPMQTTAARILELVAEHQVASRNTADSFLKELLHYRIIVSSDTGGDKRSRPVEPAESSLSVLNGWLIAHLMTLDGLDGGRRCQIYLAAPDGLRRMQPLIADGLLSNHDVRQPEKTFSLFTWLNNGGVVMEWLFSGIEPDASSQDQIPTQVLSIAEFATFLRLSRTHLDRKLREAEELGSIGWQGRRGNSAMWVSRAFLNEYLHAQAVKLAIFDAAYDVIFGHARQS